MSFWGLRQRLLRYEYLYKAENLDSKILDNRIFNFEWDIDRSIKSLSKSKEVEFDKNPGSVLKLEKDHSLINKLKSIFEDWMQRREVPGYLMKGRLILLCKDNIDHPAIIDTRLISILLAVTIFSNLQYFTI